MEKMIAILFKPFEGLVIKDSFQEVKIGLGENFRNVISKIGEPNSAFDRKKYYDRYHLHFLVNEDGDIEFVEVSRDSDVEVTVLGIKVFHTKVEDILSVLSEKHEMVSSDLGDYYDFLDIGLSFWRRFVPNLYKNKGEVYPDKEEGYYFDTCSISKKGYLEKLGSNFP